MNIFIPRDSAGFTIIEVLVTLSMLSLFLMFFFQIYLVMESQRISVVRSTVADDIAYTNLKKFNKRPDIAECGPDMDLTAAPSPTTPVAGRTIGYADSTGTVFDRYDFVPESGNTVQVLGNDVQQVVLAFAGAGCANFYTQPMIIASIVRYKNGNNYESALHTKLLNNY